MVETFITLGESTLGIPAGSADPTLTLAAGDAFNVSGQFRLRLDDSLQQPSGIPTRYQICRATFSAGNVIDIFTTTADLEGSTAQAWPAGTAVRAIVTAAALNAIATPAGSVTAYAGTAAPGGWLLCNGAAVSRTTYAALFAVLASTYGAGDGSTTFNVPDMRGRTPIGVGTGSGLTARALAARVGEENHALSLAELASHAHTASQAGHAHAAGGGSGEFIVGGGSDWLLPAGGSGFTQAAGTDSKTPAVTVNAAGSGGAHNTMQPSLALNYIVKT